MTDRKTIMDHWHERVKIIGREDFNTGNIISDDDFDAISEIIFAEFSLSYPPPIEAKIEQLIPTLEVKVDKSIYRTQAPGISDVLSIKLPIEKIKPIDDKVFSLNCSLPEDFDKETIISILSVLSEAENIQEIKETLSSLEPEMKQWFYDLKYENKSLKIYIDFENYRKCKTTLLIYSIIFKDQENYALLRRDVIQPFPKEIPPREISPSPREIPPFPKEIQPFVYQFPKIDIVIFNELPEWFNPQKSLDIFNTLLTKNNIKDIRKVISNIASDENNHIESRKKIMWFQNLYINGKPLKAHIDSEDIFSFHNSCQLAIQELNQIINN